MARRKKEPEHQNHERWLISYADFITLLFAFFVVMYSISAVNEGKFRVLSEALVAAFRSQPKSLVPVQAGKPAKAPMEPVPPINLPIPATAPVNNMPALPPPDSPRADAIRRIADELEHSLRPLIDTDLISMRRHALWLEVEIKASVLFSSGSATLEPEALPVLSRVAEILGRHPNPIRIEGFTDDRPIRTSAFPSNWELSAARSVSVVQLFITQGIQPGRMAAIGYAEHRPVAANDTEEGRAKNRRVVLVILATDEAFNSWPTQ
jgi:chemotaxis protein MotB